MRDLNEEILTGDIKLAMGFAFVSKWLKIILAIVLIYAYLVGAEWLTEIIVLSIIVSLILPHGFFDVFIQKLLEYNTQKAEERQILNATEANKHFCSVFDRIDKLEREKL